MYYLIQQIVAKKNEKKNMGGMGSSHECEFYRQKLSLPKNNGNQVKMLI